MACANQLRAAGLAYPRTCADCGLGPCVNAYADKTPNAPAGPSQPYPAPMPAPANPDKLQARMTREQIREIFSNNLENIVGGAENSGWNAGRPLADLVIEMTGYECVPDRKVASNLTNAPDYECKNQTAGAVWLRCFQGKIQLLVETCDANGRRIGWRLVNDERYVGRETDISKITELADIQKCPLDPHGPDEEMQKAVGLANSDNRNAPIEIEVATRFSTPLAWLDRYLHHDGHSTLTLLRDPNKDVEHITGFDRDELRILARWVAYVVESEVKARAGQP